MALRLKTAAVGGLAAIALATGIGISQVGAQSTPLAPAAAPAPLDVLLTNDDGVNRGGIDILRAALCAAGHRVTIVAPSGDQSGNSSRFTTSGQIRATKSTFACGSGTGDQYALASTFNGGGATPYTYNGPASPADSVKFGLSVVMAADPPDLIVSGSNPGQNAGGITIKSGTVGAALAGSNAGIPSIAVSVVLNIADVGTGFANSRGPATTASGDFLVKLIAQLQSTQRNDPALLPLGVMLNVNYPTPLTSGAFDVTKVGGPVLTTQSEKDVVPVRYVETAPGSGVYTVAPNLCGFPGTEAIPQCQVPTGSNSDVGAIDDFKISIMPMNDDLTVPNPLFSQFRGRLQGLTP